MSLPEDAAHAQVQATSAKAGEALELLGIETKALAEKGAGLLHECLTRLGDPACHGRAMNPVDRSDLIDVEPVDHMKAQDVPVLRRERAQGLVEGGLEGLRVACANVLELRILRRACDYEERLAVVVELRLQLFASAVAERRADGDGPEPAEKRPSSGVLRNFRTASGTGNEELLPHDLRDLVDGRATRTKAGERPRDLSVVAAIELPKGLCAPSCAGKREVKVVDVKALEGGHFTMRRHMLKERLPIDGDPWIGRAHGIDRRFNACRRRAPSLLLEICHRRIVG
jgi:hypothetical protein